MYGRCFAWHWPARHNHPQQQLEDSVVRLEGITSYGFKAKHINHWWWTAKFLSNPGSFITWMQAYKPGGVWRYLPAWNKFPVPQYINMTAGIYGLYKSSRTGKYELTPNEDHNDVFIYTNTLRASVIPAYWELQMAFILPCRKTIMPAPLQNLRSLPNTGVWFCTMTTGFKKYMVYFLSSWVTVVLIPGIHCPLYNWQRWSAGTLWKGLQRELDEKRNEARHMSSNNPSYYAGVIKDLDENNTRSV